LRSVVTVELKSCVANQFMTVQNAFNQLHRGLVDQSSVLY
jgi:hypothetical protein